MGAMMLAVFFILVAIAMLFVAFWVVLGLFIQWLDKRQKNRPGGGPSA
jgi:hypothetical protein